MKNKGIHIELTALLDVIFIIMFMIMVQSVTQVSSAHLEAEESGVAKEVLAAELEGVAIELEEVAAELEAIRIEHGTLVREETGRTLVEENSHVITISIHQNVGRVIFVEEFGTVTERIDLGWENRQFATNSLYAVLSDIIRRADAQAIFIVFEYNRYEIFQSDYELITNTIQRVRHGAHVYTIEHDIISRGEPTSE